MFLNLALVFLGGWTYADMIADPPAAPTKLPIRSEGGQVARPAVSPAAATTPPALAYWPPGTPRHPACACGGGGCNCVEAGKCSVIDSDCEPGLRRVPSASIAPLPVPAVTLKAQSLTACPCGGSGCSCASREGRMFPACTIVGGSCVQGKAGPPVVPAVLDQLPPPVVVSTVAPVAMWRCRDARGQWFRHADKTFLEGWIQARNVALAPPVVTYAPPPPVYQYTAPLAPSPSFGGLGFYGSGFGGGYSGGGCAGGNCR